MKLIKIFALLFIFNSSSHALTDHDILNNNLLLDYEKNCLNLLLEQLNKLKLSCETQPKVNYTDLQKLLDSHKATLITEIKIMKKWPFPELFAQIEPDLSPLIEEIQKKITFIENYIKSPAIIQSTPSVKPKIIASLIKQNYIIAGSALVSFICFYAAASYFVQKKKIPEQTWRYVFYKYILPFASTAAATKIAIIACNNYCKA